MRRRRLPRPLKWLIWLVSLALVAGGAFVGWAALSWFTIPIDTTDEVQFNRPLAIPPVATSRMEGGERVFDLRLQQGSTDFGHGATPTWGINGDYLGPTIRLTRGDAVRMRVDNQLPETTSMHWHGMHLPAEMDGGPHQPIDPGATWEPYWTVDQTAATLWYHPHLHGETASHVYRGLAGMLIVDDPLSESVPLPRDYGVDDIPVMLQDKAINDDGTLDEDTSMFQSAGLTGDTVMVNGTVAPYLDVTTQLVRLRLLNASNTRPYSVSLSNGDSFEMIASDGGLLEAPVTLDHIQLSVGERAEIVVSLDPGEEVVLRSGPSDSGDRMAGGADRLDLLQLRAAETLKTSQPLPEKLAEQPALSEADATRTRSFELSGFSINNKSMDMSRIDEIVTVDETEIWEVSNVDGGSHNFHVHDVQFQVLDVNGAPPPPELAGQKDTIWIRPRETVRLIMRFTDYTSTRWPYMFHCHTLRHEDLGMMGQFLVVGPGERQDSGIGDPGIAQHTHR